MQFGDKEHCAWMHAAQAPQQHYQVTYNAEAGRYQVQHYTNCTRSLYTFESTHCTYAVALDAAADLATPECPLLAWGYAISNVDDSRIERAAKLEEEFCGGPTRPSTLTDAQRKVLHAVGHDLYGAGWDEKRHELVRAVTHNRTESSAELTEQEAQRLIDGMRAKQAAQRPTPQPVYAHFSYR